jgi:hypothetical protein
MQKLQKALLALLLLSVAVAARADVTLNLDSRGAWTFRPANGEARPITLAPGGWRLNGFPKASAGVYERAVTIPTLLGARQQTTLLHFEGVNWEATVSAGPDAAHLHTFPPHRSPWTPFDLDLTPFVKPGRPALLRVAVRDRDALRDSVGRYTVPTGALWNNWAERGIVRGCTLRVMASAFIADAYVRPNTADNTLTLSAIIANTSDQPVTAVLHGTLSTANPESRWIYPSVPPTRVTLAPKSRRTVVIGPLKWLPGPSSWWWPNIPFRNDYQARLHTLKLTLFAGLPGQPAGTVSDFSVRFGFCTPGQRDGMYTLNGEPLNLRGDDLPGDALGTDAFCRLPGLLRTTRAGNGWEATLRNYQHLNCNVLAIQGMPATTAMLDACDELGMLVIDDAAIDGDASKVNFDATPDAFTDHIAELTRRDRNHPCVFKWGLTAGSSTLPEPLLRRLLAALRAEDSARPCSVDAGDGSLSEPGFAFIDPQSQPPGTPNAVGAKPRSDRPYGQSAVGYPDTNTLAGRIWSPLTVRSLRRHDNSDIRIKSLVDVWPGVIAGLTPQSIPSPHLPPDSLQQGGHVLPNPAAPSTDPYLALVRRSYAPVAVYDAEYDTANTNSNGLGEWPNLMPIVQAGTTVTRTVTVFNDEPFGDVVQVSIVPAHIGADGARHPLPGLDRRIVVKRGSHVEIPVTIAVPETASNESLEMTLIASKGGHEQYRESDWFTIVPASGGSGAEFIGRDDKTQGAWVGVYGSEAFLVPVMHGSSGSQIPSITVRRGVGYAANGMDPLPGFAPQLIEQEGMYHFTEQPSVNDPRVAVAGPGVSIRAPAAYRTERVPLCIRAGASDHKAHQLSLYLLDYKREGLRYDIEILDLNGRRLDVRRVSKFEEGAYFRYRFTGSVIARISGLDYGEVRLSGVFVDP